MTERTSTVVIGASAAGLAVAAELASRDIPHVVLEATDVVGTAWRSHYDRLHLHTPKSGSSLPKLPFPSSVPNYVPRTAVVDYLEGYADHFSIEPRFGERVSSVMRTEDGWTTTSTSGAIHSEHVVVATGYTNTPHRPEWGGMEEFGGDILHSSEYRNGDQWRGKKVLVVGFGNSACEIAIDLHEQGAHPELSVRSAVNVVPRDLLGIPILTFGILGRMLPLRLADALFAPLIRLVVGDITKLGLQKLPYGPMTQIHEHGRVPLLDIGTMALLRSGDCIARPDIARFTESGAVFTDGSTQDFAAVVLGTGYRPNLGAFLDEKDSTPALDSKGVPLASGGPSGVEGLWFCGFYVSPSGMLREIRLEAPRIAEAIASHR